ncbi:hypothetical protein MYU51_006683 [Penicillium brevicompactum]
MEEAKADAVVKVSSSSEDSTLLMRPKEREASTSSQREVSRDLDTEMTSGPGPSNTFKLTWLSLLPYHTVGLFPKSRFGVGTKFTFQTPTSNTWTIRQKVSQNNHQVEELDPDDVDFHVSEAQAIFFVSNDSDPNGPLAYMHPQKFDKGFIEMARLDYLSWDAWADDLVWDPVASKFWFIDFRTAMELGGECQNTRVCTKRIMQQTQTSAPCFPPGNVEALATLPTSESIGMSLQSGYSDST